MEGRKNVVVMLNDMPICIVESDNVAQKLLTKLSTARDLVQEELKDSNQNRMAFFHASSVPAVDPLGAELDIFVHKQIGWLFGGYDKDYIKAIIEGRAEEWKKESAEEMERLMSSVEETVVLKSPEDDSK